MGPAILVISAVILALGIRFLVHRTDVSRIAAAAEGAGWRSVEISFAPFAPGWPGRRKGARCYRVRFRDGDGERRERLCTTALRGGVRWVEE